ncbi:MAG: NosD domain-containing protein [Candidatus Bipolaricaulaceae bacterium]
MLRMLIVPVALCVGLTLGLMAGERGPIVITSEEQFTSEQGVISGSGTAEDPYLIAGWEIQVPAEAGYGVRIEGTTSHFILRGIKVAGANDPDGAAICLADVENAAVEDCLVQASRNGLIIEGSRGVVVRDTYLFVDGLGLQVRGTTAAEYRHHIESTNTVNGQTIYYFYGLEDESLVGLEGGHITVAGSQGVTLQGARVQGGDGIHVAFCQEVTISGADLFQNRGHGLFVFSSSGVQVRDCERIANNSLSGVAVWLSPHASVEGCGIYGNQVGLYINASDRLVAGENAFGGNGVGVLVAGAAREVTVRDSLFYQNRHGVELAAGFGPTVERCAIVEGDVGVYVDSGTEYATIRDNSIVQCGYGVSSIGSRGSIKDNLVTRANIGIIFEETYGEARPRENTVRGNVIYRSNDGLYLGRETADNWVYENLIWSCSRPARDLGTNSWAPQGRGNWYSSYQGQDADGDGIGDSPVSFSGGGQDPAPLMDRSFYTRMPGVVGTMGPAVVSLEDAAGNSDQLNVRVADQDHERFVGFQGMPEELAGQLAILFTWESPGAYGFWNPNVFVPLEVIFFSPTGDFLGDLSMPPDSRDRYTSREPFQQALEVPAEWWAELGLSAPVTISRP